MLLTFRMGAPVATDCFVAPVVVGACGISRPTVLRFPIATDFHAFSSTAILRARLVRLSGRLLTLNGSRLGSRRNCSVSNECNGKNGKPCRCGCSDPHDSLHCSKAVPIVTPWCDNLFDRARLVSPLQRSRRKENSLLSRKRCATRLRLYRSWRSLPFVGRLRWAALRGIKPADLPVAVHESGVAFFRTCRAVRIESAFGGITEVAFRAHRPTLALDASRDHPGLPTSRSWRQFRARELGLEPGQRARRSPVSPSTSVHGAVRPSTQNDPSSGATGADLGCASWGQRG
jgi:hypothetical protein